MHEGGIDHFPSIPNFVLFPCAWVGCLTLAMEGKSITILKHIGMMEEDEVDVFVDALDAKVGPTSPTPPQRGGGYGIHTPSTNCMAPI